jgi:hypothetical protein
MGFNELVLRLLNRPAYRLLPTDLTQISNSGPVSGRPIRLPAQCVADGARFLVVAGRPERKRWWRSFSRPQPARLVRGGRCYDVTGRVLTGPERDVALAAYLLARPGARRGIGPATPIIAFDT